MAEPECERTRRLAGAVYRLPGGDLFAVEIRPGAHVQIECERPDGPVVVVFSDPRPWPGIGDGWVALSLALPADVAERLFARTRGMGHAGT